MGIGVWEVDLGLGCGDRSLGFGGLFGFVSTPRSFSAARLSLVFLHPLEMLSSPSRYLINFPKLS